MKTPPPTAAEVDAARRLYLQAIDRQTAAQSALRQAEIQALSAWYHYQDTRAAAGRPG